MAISLLILQTTPKHQQTTVTPIRRTFFCTSCDSGSDVSSNGESSAKKLKKSNTFPDVQQALNETEEKDKFLENYRDNNYVTSTPACVSLRPCCDALFKSEDRERKSMSPITRSTQHMSRAMQVKYFSIFVI